MSGGTATKGQEWAGDDFPGWLSPMLVRELRQGLQSGAFAWTFVILQGAMCLLMIWSTFAANESAARAVARTGDGLFWFVTAVAVSIIVPLRGLSGVSSERIGNNLDLVRLTRLSATRIVVGKWLANVAQALLVATSILPYVVLRYFLGGVNVLRDLESLGWICVAALVVAALALALSTLPEGPRRGVMALASFGGLMAFVFFMEGGLTRAFGWMDAWAKLGILALAAVYAIAFLEYAAAEIAPPAENHAVRKRLLVSMVVAAWLVTAAIGTAAAGSVTIVATTPLVILAAIGGLLELPVAFRSMAGRFTRFGPAGDFAARLLMPGWATAIPWIVATAAMGGGAIWLFAARHVSRVEWSLVPLTYVVLVTACVLTPLPALAYLPRARQRFAVYLLVGVLCILPYVIAVAVKPWNTEWAAWTVGWAPLLILPPAALLAFISLGMNSMALMAPLFAGAGALCIVAIIAGVSRPWLREQRALTGLLAAARPRGAGAAP